MLEVAINRTKDEVDDAITQFVARRSYRLSRPWYLEDVRVEAPQLNKDDADKPKGFWSSLVEEVTPYVDVELKKKWRGTKVVIKPSAHQNSPLIGYDLQAFLHDERVYENICPPVCPRCANGVPNPGSHFCGRCGHRLAGDGGSMDRSAERSDMLQPGGMMYEDAPLLTPNGLETTAAPESDVLRPPPLVEMDEARETDAEPVAVERDADDAVIDEVDADTVSDEENEAIEAPVAIERDDVELAVEQDASEVESEQLAEDDNEATPEIEAESDHAADESVAIEATPMPEAEAEVTEADEESTGEKDADSQPATVKPESEDKAATQQDAIDDEVETDEDEDPPYERRLLAED